MNSTTHKAIQTRVIPTDAYYHDIIKAPDDANREALYRQYFTQPWQAMMQMLAPRAGDSAPDDIALAGAWHWLLPQHLREVPPLLRDLQAVKAWEIMGEALAQGAERFAPYADRLNIDTIEGWLIMADSDPNTDGDYGYTGATDFMQPRFIAQFHALNDYNLPRIPGLCVHEMHHLIRRVAYPQPLMSFNVAEYIVMEGLAESFAASLYGDDVIGFYVTEISASDLAQARSSIQAGLDRSGFDVIRGYVFGDALAQRWGFEAVGMPRFGGYAVGYHAVQAFLKRTGMSIEEASFLSGAEIVAESAYFTD